MTTINRSDVNELCDGSKWRFFFPQSKYSFETAFLDLTGIGTIYNLGCELANLQRHNRMVSWIQGIKSQGSSLSLPAERLLNEGQYFLDTERSSIQTSILTKVAYLGSLAMALIARNYLQNIAIASSVGLGAYFMAKAGFNSIDRSNEIKENDVLRARDQLGAFQTIHAS